VNTTYRCKDLVLQLTDYLEEALVWEDRQRLHKHLKKCDDCQSLLTDIRELPGLVLQADPSEAELASIGDRALTKALANLNAARKPSLFSPLPEEIRQALATKADLPLRLMAQTHEAFLRGELPAQKPFLPASVLAQLPAPEQWKWSRRGSVRRALLAKDPISGQRLTLMYAPPKIQIPAHTHLGSESLLVLHGEMEDLDRCLGDGQWIHMSRGSSHSPCILSAGCWCLVRDEGTVRYSKVSLGKSA